MNKEHSKVANELVPMIEGTIQNQPCIYGHLVEGHSVYCNSPQSPYRKCRHSWYYGRVDSIIDKSADEDCEYFEPNPNYKEDKDTLIKEIKERKIVREREQKEWDSLIAEGWLCLKCIEGCPLKNGKALCNAGTLVTGVVKHKDNRDYSDEEIDKHFNLDPMTISMRKECLYYKECPVYKELEG